MSSQPASNPCNSLQECRQVVANIERWLDITAPRLFTQPKLISYENDLLGVIATLRSAPDQEIRRCITSKDAVLTNVRQARNRLSLAIVQLGKSGYVNDRCVNHLTACQGFLASALQSWR